MEGRTTLIIAHRLSTISLADRVVLLDAGQVVADGTHTELLETTPLYAEVLAQAGEFEREADAEAADEEDGRGDDAVRRCRRPAAEGPARLGARRRPLMMFGGGGGGFGGPGGAAASAASGLPFGGIPSELQDGVDELLADEPDHAEPDIVFTQNGSEAERERLSLWRLLTEYPGCWPWPASWSW